MHHLPSVTQESARRWLWAGIVALAIAGLFSILIVTSRTPHIESFVPWKDFFQRALIVHVDLSVLVWFLALGCLLWELLPARRIPFASTAGAACMMAGSVAIAVAAFLGEPHINNYVPVLEHPVFYLGIALIFVGVACQALAKRWHFSSFSQPVQTGLATSMVITLLALGCFFYAGQIAPTEEGTARFEFLFWGAGHVLQLAYTQLMLVCWLMIAAHFNMMPKLPASMLSAIFLLGLLIALPAPFFYLSENSTYLFTHQMRSGAGVAPFCIAIALCSSIKPHQHWRDPIGASLYMSMLLFLAGGVLGYMIQGGTVTTPAHYHGSIVGVTLAFMGATYLLLPQLGYRMPEGKLYRAQPWVYGLGQLMHISGLAWSGGYGVSRKTPGATLGMEAKIGMGIMGMGGLLAIIGGLLFVIVVVRAMQTRKA